MLNMLVKNGSGAPRPSNMLVLSLRRTFAMFKKLGIEADELEGLLAQSLCHAPATLDQTAFNQLVTAAILSKGNEKPNSTFVRQVILNASAKADDHTRQLSPFVYRVADPPTMPTHTRRPPSPGPPLPWCQASDLRQPPNHLIDKFRAACFHCGRPGHWRADCPTTKGFSNPGRKHRKSVHLWPRALNTSVKGYPRSNSLSITPWIKFLLTAVRPYTCLGLRNLQATYASFMPAVSFSRIRTHLSLSPRWRALKSGAGVFPLFSGMVLSLVVRDHLVTTTFHNDCWWMNITAGEETNELAAETSSPPLIAMNPISFPATLKLSCREWHIRLGHASDKVVRSFLKQHVPSFELKSWQPFYCEVCAKSKSTHRLAKARINIPMNEPLDLLVSDIMGPFTQDPQGYQSDTLAAILDAIAHLKVQLGTSPKALRTDNSKEFISASLTTALSKLGISFHPLLPYSPQENGKAKRLNRTLGDMARAMLSES
ncbi:hypothetical protein O181_093958, partial [Austropuccinia psidii MF-1]|nr:hypothetical protein [Austropuccinia psidii MF-1]